MATSQKGFRISCGEDSCQIVPYRARNEEEFRSLRKGAMMAELLGRQGIGPRVQDSFVGFGNGSIVYEPWDGTYKDLLQKEKKINHKDIHAIMNQVEKLHEKQLAHGNLNAENIVYQTNNNSRKFYLKNLENSFPVKKFHHKAKDYHTLEKSIRTLVPLSRAANLFGRQVLPPFVRMGLEEGNFS